MDTQIRVGTMLSFTATTCDLYGFGWYMGDEIPPTGISDIGDKLNSESVKSPKIILDNGDTIWGFMCIWGKEELVKNINKDKLVNVIKYNQCHKIQ